MTGRGHGVAVAALWALAMASGPTAAAAEGWVVGGGVAFYDQATRPAVAVEWHSRPFAALGRLDVGFGVAAILDGGGAGWAGAGLAMTLPLDARWFVEASLMPGAHAVGERDTRLGGALQFRSLIGLGYRLGAGRALSLAVHHRSNGRLVNFNPGEETISLRLRLGF